MPHEFTSKLVQDLKTWCVKNRVKQVELSSMLGVGASAVTEWFKGRNHPRGELIPKIMEMIKHKPPPGKPRIRKPKKMKGGDL
jgi:DNA-binding transcriptional regulator YiaG